jgi:hypothetical protein
MMKVDELIHEAERLPAAEKWRLIKQLLRSLETEQQAQPTSSDWHEFLNETYGSLRDTPLQRWEQGGHIV